MAASRAYLVGVLCVAWLTTPATAETENTLAEQQQELVAMLQQILVQQLGLACKLEAVDSPTAFVVQIHCPATATTRLLGQSGVLLRSLKILFNDLYLDLQQQLNPDFVWQEAKKMHLRFVNKD